MDVCQGLERTLNVLQMALERKWSLLCLERNGNEQNNITGSAYTLLNLNLLHTRVETCFGLIFDILRDPEITVKFQFVNYACCFKTGALFADYDLTIACKQNDFD